MKTFQEAYKTILNSNSPELLIQNISTILDGGPENPQNLNWAAWIADCAEILLLTIKSLCLSQVKKEISKDELEFFVLARIANTLHIVYATGVLTGIEMEKMEAER